jgi:AGZA family xanthine/uracil permease-like MFS transporter
VRGPGGVGFFEARFGVRRAGSTIRREVLGGLTTFLAMAYIVVVNPVFLTRAGIPREGAIEATVIASALATLLMGLWANVPVALAPGMGLNAFFAYTVASRVSWQAGLGLVFLVSLAFLALTLSRVRAMITAAVPRTLRFAAPGGIGLFITTIGLQHAGIVVGHPATLVTMGDLRAPPVLLSLAGLAVTLALMARRLPTAIFWGMLFTAGAGVSLGQIRVDGPWIQVPSAPLPGFQMDLGGALDPQLIPLGIALLFFAIFDAMGTLYAIGSEAGLIDRQGEFPRLGRALAADAAGAVAGALLGTSPVTCYIESATGVSVGARTGLANLVTAGCFLAALFFTPLVAAVGAGVGGGRYFPVTAPALIVVGVFMVRSVVEIDWSDITEAVPAFITLVMMPATFNISHGLAAGFLSYAGMKLAAGKGRQVHWVVYLIAGLFAVRYLAMGVDS